MKIIKQCVLVIFLVFRFFNIQGQTRSISVKSDSTYKMHLDKTTSIYLEVRKNANENIEISHVFKSIDDTLGIVADIEFYVRGKKTHKNSKCSVDLGISPKWFWKNLSKKNSVIQTAIIPGCIVRPGKYKIRFQVIYRLANSNQEKMAMSNWVKLIVE